MKHKYEFLCTWVGYDVFAVDPNGGRYQIGFQLPHFDAAIKAAVSHAGQAIVISAESTG